MRRRWVAAIVLGCAPALAAQTDWTLRAAAARVRLAGPSARWLQGPDARADGLPSGTYSVHFGADAAGKPRSLQFVVPDGAAVSVATDAAAAAVGESVALGPAANGLRCGGDAEAADYRVVAPVPAGGEGAVAVLARCTGEGAQFYRFVWDRAAPEFRLERSLGGELLVLGRAAAPSADADPHALALQVDGFRIEACFDDQVVLQQLDGALSHGAFATWSARADEALDHVVRQPVAKARSSAALVATPHGAVLHAAVTVVPGHLYVLELARERSHPPLPATEGGLEPWLLLPPAAPIVLRTGLGEIGPEGVFACELHWPPFAALRKQSVLVRSLLVSPDGEAVIERTPAVRLLIP